MNTADKYNHKYSRVLLCVLFFLVFIVLCLTYFHLKGVDKYPSTIEDTSDKSSTPLISHQSDCSNPMFYKGELGETQPSNKRRAVVFMGFQNKLFAVDAETGTQKWKMQFENKIADKIAIKNGIIYISIPEVAMLYGIDAEKGTISWERGTQGSGYRISVMGKHIYVICGNNKQESSIYAYTLGKGNDIAWSKALDQSSKGYVGIGKNTIYVDGIAPRSLSALAADSGEVIWTNNNIDVTGFPVVGIKHIFICCTNHNFVKAINKKDGSIVWQTKLPGGAMSLPCVHEGKIFVGAFTGNINTFCVLSEKDGKIIWERSFAEHDLFSIAAAEQTVFVAGPDDNLKAYEISNEKLLWASDLNNIPFGNRLRWPTCPIIASSNVIVLCTSGLKAYNTETGQRVWTYRFEEEPVFFDYTSPIAAD
ncbi:PQQ-binding-like beta-propeller repeat protein [Planctomycetota bacterium]